jgi:hypothetical protein
MGIIDKLKGTPKWKHTDPAVRLEGLRETDDPGVFAEVLETDTDAKVRRAAVGKVEDPSALTRAASSDADEDVRDKASERLIAIANDANAAEATAVAATGGVTDSRRLSTIAKTSPHGAARSAALTKITDVRALGSIARSGKHENTARAAFERLSTTGATRLADPGAMKEVRDELLNVALKSDHKDLAVAAFDALVETASPDRAQLEMIETRASQKAVAKRARTLMQQMDDAEAARRTAAEEQARREQQIIDAVDQVALGYADWEKGETELARLTAVWDGFTDLSPESTEKFSNATGHARAALDARRRDAAAAADKAQRDAVEAEELARQRAEALATREALCARVETIDGEHALEQLNAIEEDWRSLSPLVGTGPEASRLAERFAVAVAACRTRHELGAQLDETRAKLEALVVSAEALPSLEETTAAAERWRPLVREARGLATVLANAARPAADLTERLDAVAAVFAGRENQSKESEEKARQELLTRVQRMTERAKRVAEADEITLKEGERLLKDIRASLDEAAAHDRKDFNDAAAALRGQLVKVAPRVRDLREMDDWRRFANAQQQERMILEAETLVAKLALEEQQGLPSDLAAAARALRDFHTKWKNAAEAPRDQAQRLWERFRTATDLIRLRCEQYFKEQRDARIASVAARTALTEEAEALAASTDWVKAATRFQELQEAWAASGPAQKAGGHDGPDPTRDLMRRFRAASNQFFSRRREDLLTRKKVWGDNQSKKEALCARAEELAKSTEWDAASAEMKKLQAEWKTIGPLRRAKSEQLWTRFRGAADLFFERYKNRHEIALAGKLAEREAWLAELDAIAAADGDAADGLAEKIQTLRTTWNRAVPIPTAEFRALVDRWQKTLAGIIAKWPDAFKGTDVDPAAAVQRMEKLVAKVETLLKDLGAAPAEQKRNLSPTEELAAKLRNAFATNAMGKDKRDDVKWRSAGDLLKDAQQSWQRLPPIVSDEASKLEQRFTNAARKVADLVRRNMPANGPSQQYANHTGQDRVRREDRGDRKPGGRHDGPGGRPGGPGGHDNRGPRKPGTPTGART